MNAPPLRGTNKGVRLTYWAGPGLSIMGASGVFATVCRYAGRNALRANLVEHAEDWPWCSLARLRQEGVTSASLIGTDEWPVRPPLNWRAAVNRPDSAAELEAVRRSVNRGVPYGEPSRQKRTATRLQLESSLRPPWRPKRTRPRKQK